jgi:DNA repair exonuclease SbcCD ATPase subunit
MKYLIPAALSLVLISSCSRKENEVANSTETFPGKDSLIQLTNERDASLNELIETFNEIERNLDSVAVKQHIIYASTEQKGKDLKRDQKNKIISEIQSINSLMNENAELVASLKRKLSKSNKKNKQLDETIVTLNNQLEQKTIELNALNERLNELDSEVAQLKLTVDTLKGQNTSKDATIKEHITNLHTAYYVIGKTKELQEAKLIDKKGGLLGIGRTTELSENFDPAKFTKIDYTQTGSIPVNGDKVKIITVHPAGSYTLEKDKDMVKNIVITDPEKFWSASKYLVIVKS